MAVLEFSMPANRFLNKIYRSYFKYVLPRIGQLLARNRQSAYEYLPASVSEFPYGQDLADKMAACGLSSGDVDPTDLRNRDIVCRSKTDFRIDRPVMTDRTRIPTNLITGFLGVGKTTAIRHLIRQKPAEERWAVLVNEFGDVGIDGAIIEAAGERRHFVSEIAGGCFCLFVGRSDRIHVDRIDSRNKPPTNPD